MDRSDLRTDVPGTVELVERRRGSGMVTGAVIALVSFCLGVGATYLAGRQLLDQLNPLNRFQQERGGLPFPFPGGR